MSKKAVRIGKTEDGRIIIHNLVFFMVFSPSKRAIYWTARRHLKDACMSFEEKYDVDWEDAAKAGYKVMKMFTTAMCKTEQSLANCDDWVAEDQSWPASEASIRYSILAARVSA